MAAAEVMTPLENKLHTSSDGDNAKGMEMQSVALNGPDELVAADSFMNVDRDGAVKIHMEDKGINSLKPISVPTFFRSTVEKIPNHTALAVKRDNQWKKWTYQEYYDDVIIAAKAFIHLGLECTGGVAIIGFNSPEWFIADLGAIFAGGIAMGIYTTNNPEACQYVVEDAKCNIVVVENDLQLQKFLKIRDNLPDLKAIIQYTGELKENYDNVYTWTQFMNIGRSDEQKDALKTRIQGIAPNKCCTLVYTSGTTGNPKGVMLSHDNLTWTAQANMKTARLKFAVESQVSYLPLSHIAAQMLDIYTGLAAGSSVYFAKPDALRGSLGETLKEVRPTSFFGVPRVWEKMAEKMQEVGRQTKGIKRQIATWAKDVGKRGSESMISGGNVPFGWGLANALIFKKVKAALGFDRCRIFLSGAAPMMRETIEYFLQLNIVITEVYGMSECSGPQCVGFPWATAVGSCGKEILGMQTKFENPDSEGNGEVCFLGRHVFMGYLNQAEKTREALDDDAWLHSGDLGRKKDGMLYITGRIKELIITAGGENVAPVAIEDAVKEALPCVSQCLVVGDKRKFLSLLITFKTDVDEMTLVPKDTLAPLAKQWCEEIGAPHVTKVSEIIDSRDEKILKAIQAGIDKANKKAVSRAASIQKWSILPTDFSIPGGELGPTMKIRRPIVHKKYKNTEDAFYT